jgi:hypothetical protein
MTDKPNDRSNGVSNLPPTSPAKKDVFSVKPLILVGVFFLVETIFIYADISSFYIFLFDLTVLIVAAVFLVVGIKRMVHGHFKSALLLILIIPFLVISLRSAQYVAYYIKFTLHEQQYLEEIKLAQPDDKGFRYKEFSWGHGTADWTGLVYDESDEFELPEASRSEEWWKKVGGHDGILSCPYGVFKIKSHFYVVSADCP